MSKPNPYTFHKPKENVNCKFCNRTSNDKCLQCKVCKLYTDIHCSKVPTYLLGMYAKTRVRYLCHTCSITTHGELKLDSQPELELSASTSLTKDNNESCSPPRSAQHISGLAQMPSAPRLSQIEETVIQKPTAPTISQLNPTYKPSTASVNANRFSEGTSVRVPVDTSTPDKNASDVLPFTYSPQLNIKNRFHSLSDMNEWPAITDHHTQTTTTTDISSTNSADSSANSSYISCGQRSPKQKQTTRTQRTPDTTTTKFIPPTCRFFLRNACRHGEKGEKCMYSHPVICKKYKMHGESHQNGCQQGANCRDFHPVLCSSANDTQKCFTQNCRLWHIKGTTRVQPKLGKSEQDLPIDQNQVPFLWEQIKVIHHLLHQIIQRLPGNWWSEIPPPPQMRQNQH